MRVPLSRSAVVVLFGTSVALTACQTTTRGTMPLQATQPTLGTWADEAAGSTIKSTCGTSISIVNSQPVKCEFSEAGYTGTFRIDAATLEKNKIATVAPKIGTSQTTFRVSAGNKPGFGSFLVLGKAGDKLEISFSRLRTDRNVACVHPRTSSQKLSLPVTGGVSGTMSFGAFAAGASGCGYVKISTGADIETPHPSADSAQDVVIDANGGPSALLTISVGEGFDGHPIFGNAMIVSGMQLMTSPDLNFPDGTYYASITTTEGTRSHTNGIIAFTAKDGVLKVASITLPNGKSFPLIFTAKTSSIIAVYPKGVEPPPPSPSPTPSTSPTPSARPTPTPTEAPTQKPVRGAYGNPPPKYGVEFGTSSYKVPSPPCTGYPAPCTGTSAIEQQTYGGSIEVPGGMFGTIKYSANIGYMGLYPPVVNNCPKEWTIIAGLDGNGTIVIPKSHPWVNHVCEITYSTLPPGKSGTYYTETLYLQGVD